jgi:hypothetical protein
MPDTLRLAGALVPGHTHREGDLLDVSHGSLVGITADQHHPRSHDQGDHTGTVGVIDLPIASLSVSGSLPAPGSGVHDFLIDGFAAGTIKELRATVKTAPTVNTTFRVMRNGAQVATVTINAGATESATTGLSVSCTAQDNYTLDITAGNGSGENALVRVIAAVGVRAS